MQPECTFNVDTVIGSTQTNVLYTVWAHIYYLHIFGHPDSIYPASFCDLGLEETQEKKITFFPLLNSQQENLYFWDSIRSLLFIEWIWQVTLYKFKVYIMVLCYIYML